MPINTNAPGRGRPPGWTMVIETRSEVNGRKRSYVLNGISDTEIQDIIDKEIDEKLVDFFKSYLESLTNEYLKSRGWSINHDPFRRLRNINKQILHSIYLFIMSTFTNIEDPEFERLLRFWYEQYHHQMLVDIENGVLQEWAELLMEGILEDYENYCD